MFKEYWSNKDRLVISILINVWLVASMAFWVWWFQPAHVGTWWGFTLASFILFWHLLLNAYSFYFILKMRNILPSLKCDKSLSVAIVVTKAPSEPFEVVAKTLEGALAQVYPHDTWIADEDPTEESLKWYRSKGVKVSCRKDHSNYHNDSWPRRRKCKEGNLAYFYDHYGYDMYDVVVQMDADHVPQPGYLEAMVRPFSDERVGYVAAPSICDSNEGNSWAARARLQSDIMFHGAIQSGANEMNSPLCIGSHYAVRTKALREIGGLGPELAEDFSTTLFMNGHGWKGCWVREALAIGEGPNSFEDIIVQDYQWARSLTMLLLSYFPRFWHKLDHRARFKFMFGQIWYPICSLAWLIAMTLPVAALLTGKSPVTLSFVNFMVFITPPIAMSFAIFVFILRKGGFEPQKAKYVSWEDILFSLARWPWNLVACLDAVFSYITGKVHTFQVTSKGKASSFLMSSRITLPYIFLASIMIFAIVFRRDGGEFVGYYYFALASTISYTILALSVLFLHVKEVLNERRSKVALLHLPNAVLPVCVMMTLIAFGSAQYSPELVYSIEVYASSVYPVSIDLSKIGNIIETVKSFTAGLPSIVTLR